MLNLAGTTKDTDGTKCVTIAVSPTPVEVEVEVPVIPSPPVSLPPSKSKLIDDYTGSKFFDGFSFFTHPDPTHGMVNYIESKELAFVNKDNNVILKVDNSKDVDGYRDSVRMTSNVPFKINQVLVLDVIHMRESPSKASGFD